ncbi:hypothetical protein XIS1_1700058 [Xenorhabdus innexi]|uniref:Uncharacterized protein n=1 Tax=Xenorhabdus innexi TaxID=290109 RepID=A0A1N6MW42_9GAMM|nr:hypothetical protein XIS1_1700058 [Xenorhabdus innexi]
MNLFFIFLLYNPSPFPYYPSRSQERSNSSIVQSVERRTVNPYVTGSSPVGGAKFKEARFSYAESGFLLNAFSTSESMTKYQSIIIRKA